MHGSLFISQEIPPATTQSELYLGRAGWASAALVVVVFTGWTYRRLSPQRLALKEAAYDAVAHWALQRTTADQCSLTNTSPEPARVRPEPFPIRGPGIQLLRPEGGDGRRWTVKRPVLRRSGLGSHLWHARQISLASAVAGAVPIGRGVGLPADPTTA